ncbi:hypothetical protein STEG23_011852, partial [Scotinomys teguina]
MGHKCPDSSKEIGPRTQNREDLQVKSFNIFPNTFHKTSPFTNIIVLNPLFFFTCSRIVQEKADEKHKRAPENKAQDSEDRPTEDTEYLRSLESNQEGLDILALMIPINFYKAIGVLIIWCLFLYVGLAKAYILSIKNFKFSL